MSLIPIDSTPFARTCHGQAAHDILDVHDVTAGEIALYCRRCGTVEPLRHAVRRLEHTDLRMAKAFEPEEKAAEDVGPASITD